MRGGAWFGGEREEGWMMTLSARLVGAVWMALDHLLIQTHAADAPRERLRERNPGAENWGKRRRRRCEGDSKDCLSQHRHAAVPRNPSSKRGTASLSPWL